MPIPPPNHRTIIVSRCPACFAVESLLLKGWECALSRCPKTFVDGPMKLQSTAQDDFSKSPAEILEQRHERSVAMNSGKAWRQRHLKAVES